MLDGPQFSKKGAPDTPKKRLRSRSGTIAKVPTPRTMVKVSSPLYLLMGFGTGYSLMTAGGSLALIVASAVGASLLSFVCYVLAMYLSAWYQRYPHRWTKVRPSSEGSPGSIARLIGRIHHCATDGTHRRG